jgi:hypothetical protein
MPILVLCAALAFAVAPSGTSYADNDKKDDIDHSVVQQGFDSSPIPKEKLNLKGKNPYLVGLGSYLVNAAGDCNGCHTFPRFLRPGGTVPGTNGNATGNLTNQGSNPKFGNPYLDKLPATPANPDGFQPLNGQLKANTNVKHFLAGGRCFGFFMARNITPDDSGKPRGLSESEFIQVMRQGKDISCSKANPPSYGGKPDPICDPNQVPEGAGAGVSFNPEVLQTMPWPTYHSMTDRDLKAIYAYLSALPQTTACNTVQNGCSGWFGDAKTLGVVGQNAYAYANTDDCPKNSNNTSPPQ